jgi:hypothetical protein
LKLSVKDIRNEDAVEALFDELSLYPYVQSVSISWGGVFGKTVTRDFQSERVFEDVMPRVMVQQFTMKNLNKRSIKKMIRSLERQIVELKEQLKGLEYTAD